MSLKSDHNAASPPASSHARVEGHWGLSPGQARSQLMKLTRILLDTRPMRRMLDHRASSVAILMYHGVVPDGTHPPLWTQLERSAFRSQMAYLADHRPVISVPELVAALEGTSTLPPHAVVITFDDGYLNVLEQALPELERFRLPATLFMTAGHFSGDLKPSQLLWFDQIYDAHAQELNHGQAEDVYARTRMLKRLPEETRHKVIASLYGDDFQQLPVATEHPRRLMTVDELRTLAASPLITIGAHSLTHGLLTRMPLAQAKREIETSRRVLQEILGKPIETFAFPDGALDPEVTQLVREAGFKAAFSTIPGAVQLPDDRFTLKRYPVGMDTSLDRFALTLLGLDEILASMPSRSRWKDIYG